MREAVSLLQELRKTLVPSAAAYKLDKLMAAVCVFQEQSDRKVGLCLLACHSQSQHQTARSFITFTAQVFVEYVVLAGVNDQPEQAQQLADLLQVRAA